MFWGQTQFLHCSVASRQIVWKLFNETWEMWAFFFFLTIPTFISVQHFRDLKPNWTVCNFHFSLDSSGELVAGACSSSAQPEWGNTTHPHHNQGWYSSSHSENACNKSTSSSLMPRLWNVIGIMPHVAKWKGMRKWLSGFSVYFVYAAELKIPDSQIARFLWRDF